MGRNGVSGRSRRRLCPSASKWRTTRDLWSYHGDLGKNSSVHDYLKKLGVTLVAANSPDHFVEYAPTARLIRRVLSPVAQFGCGRVCTAASNSFTPRGIGGVSRRNDRAGHPTARCCRFEVCCRRSSGFIHWRSSSTRRFLARPFSFVFDAIGAKKPTPDALRRCGSILYSLTRAPTTSAARARDKSRLES